MLHQRLPELEHRVHHRLPGWLHDRFGPSWQVVPTRLPELLGDPDPARAQRAMTALTGMGEIDIGQVEQAAKAG